MKALLFAVGTVTIFVVWLGSCFGYLIELPLDLEKGVLLLKIKKKKRNRSIWKIHFFQDCNNKEILISNFDFAFKNRLHKLK